MEKFSKWDDPSNGLNPFMPIVVKNEPWNWFWTILRKIASTFFVVSRLPCVMMAVGLSMVLHALKFLFLIPILIRIAERFIDNMCGRLVLSVTSFNNFKE